MRPDEYTRTTLVQMQARRWRTRRELRNGNLEIPAGTEVQIVGKRGGLALSGVPCDACGVKVFITRVPPSAVEEVFE